MGSGRTVGVGRTVGTIIPVSSRDMSAYMRAYRELVELGFHQPVPRTMSRRRISFRPPVRRPLHDVPEGHCVFCGLESVDPCCVTCRHEIEAA